MASSAPLPSSSSAVEWKYDVFLSFRGPDTRKGIISELYDQLQRRGINTFKDDRDLEVGDLISRTLISAIEESRFAIVVLSQNYASSIWCLEELTKICECMEDQNRILPLFYHVEPSDVRYQKKSFEKAFSEHETSQRHRSEKMKQWRDALNKVATFSGWNTSDHKTHKELVDVVVEFLCDKVVPDAIDSTGDFEAFEATRQAMNEVMEALKDDEVTAVGVYGMGGVGKTTMVKHVGAQARKSGIFNYVIVGVVSQNPDLERIQDTLAELLGFELHEKTVIGRAARLNKEIMRREKILIILDDIWEMIDLSDIGIRSYKELHKCNSKVLLTTRIRNVCHAMKCQEMITLNVLSEEDSWTLFVRNAERSCESFDGVAKKVAGECRGLPIALKAVARALGDKEPVEWERAARALVKSQSANPDDKGEAHRCIKLSYDYLKDEDYKSYFLLCCLFPEDYQIKMKNLFGYAIGKGLFRDAETLEEARDKADSVARHLKYSCLLLEGEKDGCVKMHDVVRDTAIQIAQSKDGFLVKASCGLKDWPRGIHECYSAVSLPGNHISKLPEELVLPKLQILLLNNNPSLERIPETFFQSMNELLVLDLCETGHLLLPQSLGLLTNLRALFLDNCYIFDGISMIGKLEKLEILSMRQCILGTLPREIGVLTNLRMLDVTNSAIQRIPSKVISNLHGLEELRLRHKYLDWGSRVAGEGEETNAGFDEVTCLSKLRVLEVSTSDAECIPKSVDFNPNWVEFNISIGFSSPQLTFCFSRLSVSYMRVYDRYHNLITLKLDTISSLPDWFRKAVMNKANRLCWKEGRRLIDIFVESEDGRLHALKHLEIIDCCQYEQMNTITWVPKKPVFENLEDLHLCHVDCQELCVGDLPPGSLFKLQLLDLEYCDNWGNVLLPSRLLQGLPDLEVLHCYDMEGIEYVFGCGALFQPKQSKLRVIKLICVETVRSICDGPAPPAIFQALQDLSISCCNVEGSLFTSDVAQCLFQLKYVYLRLCPFLERIVEANNKKIILPKLKKLHVSQLQMYHESAPFNIECPSLEELRVDTCPKFSISPSDFHSRKQVQFDRIWS